MKNKIHPLMIIRYLMLAALLVCAVLLQLGSKISNTPAETVLSNVAAACDLSGAVQSDNRMFKRLYQLNAGDYENVVLYIPASNMDVQELLIVKLRDSSQAESVEAAVNTRLQSQMDSFEGYGVEQYHLLENHVLEVQGNYVFYLVHSDASKGREAFLDSL